MLMSNWCDTNTPQEQHKVKVLKNRPASPTHPTLHTCYITMQIGVRTVITALTHPVIKLFPRKQQELLRWLLRFPAFPCILIELYQFYIHHSQEIERKDHADTTTCVADHPALQSQTFTGSSINREPRETHRGLYRHVILLPYPHKLSLINQILHAELHTRGREQVGQQQQQVMSHRREKCCSLFGAALSLLQFSLTQPHGVAGYWWPWARRKGENRWNGWFYKLCGIH